MGGGAQGEAFMAALQQVPAQYFSDDFESKWCVACARGRV